MTARHIPGNAGLVYFTVTCHLAPIVADLSQDADYDPNTARIDAVVTFTPKYKAGEVIHSHTSTPPTGFLALPVTALIDDGYLKLRSKPDAGAAPLPGTLHGLKAKIAADTGRELELDTRAALNYAPVRLLGNSTSLEIDPEIPLYYDFSFSQIKIDGKPTNIVITGGTFEAPWEDTVIDLLDYMPLTPGPYAAPMVVGPAGPPGPPGPATVDVGSTTTSEPGTDAQVINTTGSNQDLLLDFVIPRGEPGPAGPAGASDWADVTNKPEGVPGGFPVLDSNSLVPVENLPVKDIRKYHVDDYGGDPTGAASSDAALAAIAAEMGSLPGKIVFGPGNYLLNATINLGPYQSVIGQGRDATILQYTGSGDCIRMQDPAPYISALEYFPPAGQGGPRWAGRIQHLSIDGTGSGADAAAIHVGDITRPVITDVNIWNFEGANAKGVWFDNRVTWCEKAITEVSLQYCTEAVVFEDNNLYGPGSFPDSSKSYAYSLFKFYIVAKCNQSGVRLTDVNLVNLGEFTITGNFFNNTSATENAGVVLRIVKSRLETPAAIMVEASGNEGNPGHKTIVAEDGGNARMFGTFYFMGSPPGTPGIPFQDGSDPGLGVALAGVIDIDNVYGKRGGSANIFRTRGSITGSPGYLTADGKWYPFVGNHVARTLNPGNTTITLPATFDWLGQTGPTAENLKQAASWDFFLEQPVSMDATVTWPANFVWSTGFAPTLTKDASRRVDWIRVSTKDFVTFYAHHVNGKRFSYPTLEYPRINEVLDINGNPILSFTAVASSVNFVRFSNASAGGAPRMNAVGTDTNIPFSIFTKGNGSFLVRQESGANALQVNPVVGGANYLAVNQAVASATPSISAVGTDGVVSINLVPKGGTGVVQANGTQVEVKGHTHTVAQVAGALSWAAVPANAAAPGTAGQIAYDAAGFFYLCTAPNTWVRTQLAAW